MNEFGLKKKISTKTYHETGIFLIIALLGLNYLLFAFFEIENYKTTIRLVTMLLLVIIYFYKEKVAFHNIIILGISAYLVLIQGSLSINIAYLLIAGMCLSRIDEAKIYKYMHIVNIATLIITAASLFLGIRQTEIYEASGRYRESLGFYSVNVPGLLSYSVVSIILLSSKKINYVKFFAALALAIWVFTRTNSRTGFIGTVVLCALLPIFCVVPYYIKKTVLPVAATLLFASPFIWLLPRMQTHEMNLKFSFRPWHFKVYFEHLTKRNFLFGGTKLEDVDNFYLVFLGNAGAIVYIGVLIMLIFTILKLAKDNDNKKLAFIFSALAVATTESSLIRPEIMCMLAFWVVLFKCFQDIKTDRKVEVKRSKYIKYKT